MEENALHSATQLLLHLRYVRNQPIRLHKKEQFYQTMIIYAYFNKISCSAYKPRENSPSNNSHTDMWQRKTQEDEYDGDQRFS